MRARASVGRNSSVRMIQCRQTSRRRAAARLAGTFVLAGCAHQAALTQTVEVRVEADSQKWAGPLSCRATNAVGSWAFSAPGTVTLLPSASSLHIACQAPDGASAEPSVTPPDASSTGERSNQGAATGAKVGAGAGVALGVAAAPVMGGAFAMLIAVGAAMKGGEIGGIVGALSRGGKIRYPSPVVIRIRSRPSDRTDHQ